MSAASRLPLVGWLFPSPDEPGAVLARRTQVQQTILLTLANLVGASVVLVFLGFVIPTPAVDDPDTVLIVNVAVAGAVLGTGMVIGTIWGSRRLRPVRDWLRSDRPATEAERLTVLRAPKQIAGVHAALWSGSAVLFAILNLNYSSELAGRVGITILLGGLTTCAIAYLVTERGMRPAAARAMAEEPPAQPVTPGITARTALAWVLGTGVPLLGIAMACISTLAEGDFTADQLAATTLGLAGIAIATGLYVSVLAARAVADPVRAVREGVSEVERGNLDVEVEVYDGSEIGLLQAGFNRMVAGLRERERIHDLFGRHVGEDVARAALASEVELGGETRDVSVLFVDMVGSTQLASERAPQEVVDTLNEFFAVVIEVVGHHGGWVNKFEGDAALAIFGAPVALADHASKALAAARELGQELAMLESFEAGIGVSSGEAVAGNIGEEQRFEYTVIGDPVNEAARLTDVAKGEGGVLASDAAIERASIGERSRWELGDAIELRGRARPTRPAKPRAQT